MQIKDEACVYNKIYIPRQIGRRYGRARLFQRLSLLPPAAARRRRTDGRGGINLSIERENAAPGSCPAWMSTSPALCDRAEQRCARRSGRQRPSQLPPRDGGAGHAGQAPNSD